MKPKEEENKKWKMAKKLLSEAGYTGELDLRSLIDACGNDFFGIHFNSGHCGLWCAENRKKTCWAGFNFPEAAVANLLIEVLNKKNNKIVKAPTIFTLFYEKILSIIHKFI